MVSRLSALRYKLFGATALTTVMAGYTAHRIHSSRDDRHFVIDLDHTLIHSVHSGYLKPKGQLHGILPECDFKAFEVEENGKEYKYNVYKRRWADFFLSALNTMGHVHLFTMGTESYAKTILSDFDPDNKYFKLVLDRAHGLSIGDRVYCKDLDVVKQIGEFEDVDPHKVLLIDDKRRSFVIDEEYEINQEPNGIQVKPYDAEFGQDNVLLQVLGIITYRIVCKGDKLTNDSNERTVVGAP